MRHENLLDADRAVLVIVDLQEKFRCAIDQFDAIARRSAIVAEAAKLLNIPIMVTEQSSGKLGPTVDEIKRVLPESAQLIDKTAFSCCGADAFCSRLESSHRRQVILCGIESHVCVNQTAHDLLTRGYQVHLLTDCTSSRTRENRELGISKMLTAGVLPSSTEMALFELLRDANHARFRDVQKLIK